MSPAGNSQEPRSTLEGLPKFLGETSQRSSSDQLEASEISGGDMRRGWQELARTLAGAGEVLAGAGEDAGWGWPTTLLLHGVNTSKTGGQARRSVRGLQGPTLASKNSPPNPLKMHFPDWKTFVLFSNEKR